MTDTDSDFFVHNSETAPTIKELIGRYLSYWPLFTLSFALCISGSYLYLRYAIPKYVASTLILVKQQDAKSSQTSTDLIQEALTGEQKDNLDNEIQIMQSQALMNRVVLKNQFNISYYRIGKFRKTDMYLDAPFRLLPKSIGDSNSTAELTLKNFTPLGITVVYGGKNNIRTLWVKWNTPFKILSNQYVLTRHGKPLPGDDNFMVTWNSIKQASSEISGRFSVGLYDKKTTILQLSINIENLQRGKDILNAIAQEFIVTDVDDKNAVSQNAIRFIDDRLNIIYGELTGVEGSLENYQGNNNIVNVTSQSTQSFENSNNLSKTLTDNSIQQGVITMIESYFNDPNNKDKLVPSSLGIEDATLASLIARYNELQLNKERQTPLVTSNSIVLKDINNQLNDVKGSILESLQNITKNLKLQQTSMQQKNSQYSQFLSSLPHKERIMQEIKRKQSITEGLYLYLLQKREEAAISSSSSNVSTYKQIDGADSSGPPNPNETRVYTYAAILAILLPIGLVQLRTMMNDKIMKRSDVTAKLRIPILGELAHVAKANRFTLSILNRTLIGEQFRVIRTNLLFWLRDKHSQTILVTSTVPGEGKSFISLNFASVLATTGKKVALLEFDLRKPGITKKLKMHAGPGLSDYISGSANSLSEIYQASESIPTLHIYPCGTSPENPADLLLNENCKTLFALLKQQYEYIIVDTPPTTLVTDAFILSDFCDAVMYVVQQRHTLKKQLGFINDIFKTQKLMNMFLIVNDIKSSTANEYSYDKGYGNVYDNVKRNFFYKMFLPKRA